MGNWDPAISCANDRAYRVGAWILLAVALSACAPPPIYLFVEPSGSVPRVELRQPVGIVSRREVPIALADCGFYEAKPATEGRLSSFPVEIWRVVSLSPDEAALGLRYGETPEGFTQVTPAAGPPPPLEPGRRYTVECTGDGIGMAEFEIPATPP